jgi:hypothetical protein
MKRNARAGLFTGWWTDLDGTKIRRIYRSEYPELYRLHKKHLALRLGIALLGMRALWHHKRAS